MQLKLGRRADYALRAVIDLARHHQSGRRKARQISAAMDIPRAYLSQILAELVRHRLLRATSGPQGGYTLARDPGDITLLEVIEMAEGPTILDRCVLSGGPCDWEHVCPLHEPWSAAQAGCLERLASTTFSDIAQIDAAIEGGTYQAPADFVGHRIRTRRHGTRT